MRKALAATRGLSDEYVEHVQLLRRYTLEARSASLRLIQQRFAEPEAA